MKIYLQKIWQFIKKFPFTTYEILFLMAYVLWIVVDVDTSKELNIFWKFAWLIFLPMIASVIILSEVIASSNTGMIYEIVTTIIPIMILLFIMDLIILYIRQNLVPKLKQNFCLKSKHTK